MNYEYNKKRTFSNIDTKVFLEKKEIKNNFSSSKKYKVNNNITDNITHNLKRTFEDEINIIYNNNFKKCKLIGNSMEETTEDYIKKFQFYTN